MTGATAAGLMGQVRRHRLSILLAVIQVAFIIIYALIVTPKLKTDDFGSSAFSGFQDAHLGIVLGFGLLLAFLKRYSVSGLAFNLLLVAVVIQWAFIVQQVFLTRGERVLLSLQNLVMSDFGVLTVLVSLGAVVGKLTPFQLIVMALVEIIFATINYYIGSLIFQAVDAGWSMYAHVFGAFFGLAVSRFTFQQHHVNHPQIDATYTSDIFTIIGTLILWVVFPGLNGVLAAGTVGELAVVNTILALAAATIVVFALTIAFCPEERFCVVHLQNAVLAGGVAVATCAHLYTKAYAAMIIGVLGGFVSVFGFRSLQPRLGKFRLSDSRGVLSLHGLPGIVAVVASFLIAGLLDVDNYGALPFYQSFPAMVPANASVAPAAVTQFVNAGELAWGSGRTGWIQGLFQLATLGVTILIALISGALTGSAFVYRWIQGLFQLATLGVTILIALISGALTGSAFVYRWIQGLFQLATLGVTILIALISGALTGFLLGMRCFRQLTAEEVFDDKAFWAVHTEGIPSFVVYVPPPVTAADPVPEEEVELQPKTVPEEVKAAE